MIEDARTIYQQGLAGGRAKQSSGREEEPRIVALSSLSLSLSLNSLFSPRYLQSQEKSRVIRLRVLPSDPAGAFVCAPAHPPRPPYRATFRGYFLIFPVFHVLALNLRVSTFPRLLPKIIDQQDSAREINIFSFDPNAINKPDLRVYRNTNLFRYLYLLENHTSTTQLQVDRNR